jgi:hypothetical protein
MSAYQASGHLPVAVPSLDNVQLSEVRSDPLLHQQEFGYVDGSCFQAGQAPFKMPIASPDAAALCVDMPTELYQLAKAISTFETVIASEQLIAPPATCSRSLSVRLSNCHSFSISSFGGSRFASRCLRMHEATRDQ